MHGHISARKGRCRGTAGLGHVRFHIHHDAQLGVKVADTLQIFGNFIYAPADAAEAAALFLKLPVAGLQFGTQMTILQPFAPQPDIAGQHRRENKHDKHAEPAPHTHVAAAAGAFPENDDVVFAEKHIAPDIR